MARKAKYTIEYGGRMITLYEYAKLIGVCPQTLRNRMDKGTSVFTPVRPRNGMEDGMTEEQRRNILRFGYPDGYTRKEIEDLYDHFAGNEEELQILMDFTGMDDIHASELLEDLKYQRRKKSS